VGDQFPSFPRSRRLCFTLYIRPTPAGSSLTLLPVISGLHQDYLFIVLGLNTRATLLCAGAMGWLSVPYVHDLMVLQSFRNTSPQHGRPRVLVCADTSYPAAPQAVLIVTCHDRAAVNASVVRQMPPVRNFDRPPAPECQLSTARRTWRLPVGACSLGDRDQRQCAPARERSNHPNRVAPTPKCRATHVPCQEPANVRMTPDVSKIRYDVVLFGTYVTVNR